MSEFFIYLTLGYQHITDLNGFDHLLFLVALCAIYSLQQWKDVLILVTAFTLGHSVTLALATQDILKVNAAFIEFLIPITIILTCLVNFFYKFKRNLHRSSSNPKWLRYGIATLFGLIHGLGFSTYLKSLLGAENSIFKPLLAFNIGLEFGQILIVAIALFINFLLISGFGLKKRTWNLILSGIVMGMSLMLVIDKL
ncbi:MAG: hypothetical protein ACI9IP_000617 [Arcticibacterium sp.]|jgi:hypothetical protein